MTGPGAEQTGGSRSQVIFLRRLRLRYSLIKIQQLKPNQNFIYVIKIIAVT